MDSDPHLPCQFEIHKLEEALREIRTYCIGRYEEWLIDNSERNSTARCVAAMCTEALGEGDESKA